MDWMQQLGGIVGRYQGTGGTNVPDTVHQDFDQFAQTAPRSTVAEGLAAAFRSDQTPAFGNMVGQLFGNSPGVQRANILGSLLSAVGPGVLGQILARRGAAADARQIESGQVTPEVADRIPPEAVQEMAEHAEKKDPSIIDRISHAYAEQPQIVKTLGKAALAVAMAHAVQKQYAGRR